MAPSKSISDAIRLVVKQDGRHPFDINQGTCYNFAAKVVALASGEVIENEFYNHAFILHEGKYYDAEEPEGVEEWEQLPFIQRAKRFNPQ